MYIRSTDCLITHKARAVGKKNKKRGEEKFFLGWLKKYSLASFGSWAGKRGLQECIFCVMAFHYDNYFSISQYKSCTKAHVAVVMGADVEVSFYNVLKAEHVFFVGVEHEVHS